MRQWLKDARMNQRLTMKQVADALGITESYYCYIENGERQKKMDIAIASRLANVLGMDLADIIAEETA